MLISLVMVKTSDCGAAVQIAIHVLGDCFSLLLFWLNMLISLDQCMGAISELKFHCVPYLICLLSLYNRFGDG